MLLTLKSRKKSNFLKILFHFFLKFPKPLNFRPDRPKIQKKTSDMLQKECCQITGNS